MNWNKLESTAGLEQAFETSFKKPVLLFKHSTRCSISATALNRLERNWGPDAESTVVPYYLDLIAYRELSNQIADRTKVTHESPQVIVLVDGQPVYNASHLEISLPALISKARAVMAG